MRCLACVLGYGIFVSLLAAAEPDQLVGVWKLSRTESKLPKDATAILTFEKNGQMMMNIEIPSQMVKVNLPGKWSLNGDELTVVQKAPDGKENKETMTIKELTATRLVTLDGDRKKDEFERVK